MQQALFFFNLFKWATFNLTEKRDIKYAKNVLLYKNSGSFMGN